MYTCIEWKIRSFGSLRVLSASQHMLKVIEYQDTNALAEYRTSAYEIRRIIDFISEIPEIQGLNHKKTDN